MEYPDHLVITIGSEEDAHNFVRDYKDFLLERRDEFVENSCEGMDDDFITSFRKIHSDDNSHLEERAKGFISELKRSSQYAFLLNSGTIIAAIQDGKLVAVKS